MASQLRSAGLGQSIPYGNRLWSYPTRIYASDDSSSYSNLAPDDTTYWLRATTFGFTIPAGATIDGIKVEIEKRANDYGVEDLDVKIVKAGAEAGTDKGQTGVEWPLTDTYYTYGGTTDKWGLAWAATDINASNFGVSISANFFYMEGSARAYVDHIRITVYYTVEKNIKINIGDAWKDVIDVKINVGDTWKTVTGIWINIGDVWKQVF